MLRTFRMSVVGKMRQVLQRAGGLTPTLGPKVCSERRTVRIYSFVIQAVSQNANLTLIDMAFPAYRFSKMGRRLF